MIAEELPKGVTLLKPDQIKWVKTPSGREDLAAAQKRNVLADHARRLYLLP